MMLHFPLALLRVTCPSWLSIASQSLAEIQCTAVVQTPAAADDLKVDLRISANARGIAVGEATVGTIFPSACPERHINDDGTFCLALEVEHIVTSTDAANVWWGLLARFLKLQRTAMRTGIWPVHQALSHGNAGKHHQDALAAAKELGIEDQFYEMLAGKPAWFSSRFAQIGPSGDCLINGRSPCPMGCKDRRARPILRRDCCKRQTVVTLVAAERQRRKAEELFWAEKKNQKKICCGTMKKCPLAAECPLHQGAPF